MQPYSSPFWPWAQDAILSHQDVADGLEAVAVPPWSLTPPTTSPPTDRRGDDSCSSLTGDTVVVSTEREQSLSHKEGSLVLRQKSISATLIHQLQFPGAQSYGVQEMKVPNINFDESKLSMLST